MTRPDSSSGDAGSSSTAVERAPMHDVAASTTTTRSDGDLEGASEKGKDLGPDDAASEVQDGKGYGRHWYPPFSKRKAPEPPADDLESVPMIPDLKATFLSIITFHWIQPMLVKGSLRPLEKGDLWKLDEARSSSILADSLDFHFAERQRRAEAWNARLRSGEVKPSWLRKLWWKVASRHLAWGREDGYREASLAAAISDTFFWQFWSAGFLKIISDGLTVTSPFVTRALITYGAEVWAYDKGYPGASQPPSAGRGYGLTVGLLGMQVVASLCLHQFFYRSMSVGVLSRGALITAIYRRSLSLSAKARTQLPNSKLVAHISTDVSRIDFCLGFFHMAWTAPIQLVVVIIILIVNLGPSALAGIGLMLLVTPVQAKAMRFMFGLRRKAMVWTDKRAKLIQELLGGIKILKFFAWEVPYFEKLKGYRQREMRELRRLLITRAATAAVSMSLPLLGSVLAFVTYAAVGHSQNPANIFTSLTLFNLLRMPLMMLPIALGTITDAQQAIGRLEKVFTADRVQDTYRIDHGSKYALEVTDGEFKWESEPPKPENPKGKAAIGAKKPSKEATAKPQKRGRHRRFRRWIRNRKDGKITVAPEVNPPAPAEKEALAAEGTDVPAGPPVVPASGDANSASPPEQSLVLRNINLRVKKGSLTAIVGPVGSGKSSLLQAVIGEMKRLHGDVVFGGAVGYCHQVAWIQNATLRENILFGQPFDEERYWKVIEDACLGADLKMLPNGDLTEIGEKGVTLSGGQKQRVAIGRALYVDPSVLMLDDPLSAVDAHVGKHLFEHAIRDRTPGTTRILVTHALHFLPKTDYIFCVEDGRIAEEGTYEDLMRSNGAFANLVNDFGGEKEEEQEERDEKEEDAIEGALTDPKVSVENERAEMSGGGRKAEALMQTEERATGVVGWRVYVKYFRFGHGSVMVPLLVIALVAQQASTVLSSYWLVWWQENQFNKDRGFYEAIYAALGIFQTIASFLMGATSATIGFYASQAIHNSAAKSVLHAPQSFFDTQPTGRIMSRFVKDTDTIDNTLNDSMRMALATLASITGSVILIAIVSQYFLIAMAGIVFIIWQLARFYRVSARDIKRLDNLLRSALYAHFSESLSGLATIRAYGVKDKFLRQSSYLVDLENRAYLLTVINQRWLSVRLDLFGALLTFIVAIISVAGAKSISPSKIGLILTYILTISQSLSWCVRQTAEVENDFNSVERLFHYGEKLEQEAPSHIPETQPPKDWPREGKVDAKDLVMAYRPGLPNVLKGLSMSVKGGEKIGVVGRTGAGKSSIMMALFRIVELSGGEIEIDGVDVSKIGLDDLRRAVAIIPQEATLFNGTIRSNLDPFGVYDDARLWDALKRAGVVDRTTGAAAREAAKLKEIEGLDDASSSASDLAQTQQSPNRGGHSTPVNRYSLDSVVEDEGLNLSVGERSLVSLARALVKNSQIIVLDEATASVDFETDARIQETIRTEFAHATLLCIAHRLRTIINYDRIVVMDAGRIAEFDTPLNLYDQEDSAFRSMCERSSISRDDIRRAQSSSSV